MKRRPAPSRYHWPILGLGVALALLVAALSLPSAIAGFGGGFGNNNAVGGIIIDAAGLVRAATLDERAVMLNRLRNAVSEPQGVLAEDSDLRMISLKKLQGAISDSLSTGDSLPEDMRFLAGLQRIEYVFVYPEQNDIVLAGPAEPWMIRDDASVVGKQSGRPVLLLSDLITAIRSVEPSREAGISCSIEPTVEGRQRLNKMLSRIRLAPGQDPSNLEPMMREAFGPQMIKLKGIPEDSHYARVLLAADYQMKRIAMALETSPVDGLPSYMEMARNDRHQANESPRWWMACDYDSLRHDADKLAWRISGQGVKTLTEQDQFDRDGQMKQTGRSDRTAAKWAEMMTERFDALAEKQSIFGDLRNLMDLSVVATLIVQENLDQIAGLDMAVLSGAGINIPLPSYDVPKAMRPQCSFIRGANGWVATASGGVEVIPFEVVEKQSLDAAVGTVRTQASINSETDSWWWNG
jgi:hypothetical protein